MDIKRTRQPGRIGCVRKIEGAPTGCAQNTRFSKNNGRACGWQCFKLNDQFRLVAGRRNAGCRNDEFWHGARLWGGTRRTIPGCAGSRSAARTLQPGRFFFAIGRGSRHLSAIENKPLRLL